MIDGLVIEESPPHSLVRTASDLSEDFEKIGELRLAHANKRKKLKDEDDRIAAQFEALCETLAASNPVQERFYEVQTKALVIQNRNANRREKNNFSRPCWNKPKSLKQLAWQAILYPKMREAVDVGMRNILSMTDEEYFLLSLLRI
jgi:hypothetical protein